MGRVCAVARMTAQPKNSKAQENLLV